ncbi:MAG: hypothetical protein WCY82_01700 [Desulfotomaculaceae bacterium]
MVYSRELAGYLSPNNAWYTRSRLVSEAADAKTFEIPQLSQPGEVHEGEPDSLPVKIKLATDSKKTGTMNMIWADPIAISSESQVVTNYNKRQNHQQQQAAQIETKVADVAAYGWCPTASGLIVHTTGTGRASNVTGVTGNRKAVTKKDMIDVQAVLRRSNIFGLPGGLFGLVTDDVYSDLLNIDDFVNYEKLGVASKLSMGILGMIMGIEIMTRSNGYQHIGVVLSAANAKLSAVTTAASDKPVSLFWNEAYVCRGETPVQVSINQSPAGYLGATVIEAWKRFGATPIREDGKGTVALAEAVAEIEQ